MNTLNKIFLITWFFSFGFNSQGQESHKHFMPIPTEEEAGRVFIASLITAYTSNCPDSILIYPYIYMRDQKPKLANEVYALIQKSSISDFLDRIASPTHILSADESCPNLVFTKLNNSQGPQHVLSPILIGSILIDLVEDKVRLRLHTDNPIYPQIDFVYIGTGLAPWLEKRYVLSAGK
ncbi:MAG: hypothetical protein OJI67_03610 [Prosthecobacter sp.]|nr:hypothetical protein [Prosthecobacter sp.]